MLTSSLGHVSVTEVDGTTFTGLYAADGSLNVYDATSDTVPNGLYHPCGAMNITITDGTTLTGRYANNGSLYVVIDSTQYGVYHSCGAMNITGIVVSNAVSFLSEYGPYGMVMDFTDASIAIDDITDVLNYTSIGQVSSGALLGPGSKLTYSAPSVKLTEQSDGFLKFQAHNLCLWSNDFSNAAWNKIAVTVSSASSPPELGANAFRLESSGAGSRILQSVTLFGDSAFGIWVRRVSGSGNVSLGWDLSTPTVLALTSSWQFFQIAANLAATTYTPRITFADSGDIIEVCAPRIRRTPSVDTYIATTSTAAYDLPYVYSGGALQDIMVEPAATNRNAHAFAVASWTGKAGVTVTDNTTVAPDGTTTADTLAFTSAGYAYTNNSSVGSTATLPFTGSIWLKGTPGDKVGLRVNNANTGVGNYILITLTANWVRYSVSASIPFTAGNSVTMGLDTRNAVVPGTGAAVTLQAWGAQVEDGLVATSLIPTYGAAVARVADTVTSLLSLFPSIGTAYTVYAKYKPQSASIATTTIRLDDTTTNELVSLGNDASGAGLVTVTDGGVSQASSTSGTITASAFHRVAASIEANNVLLVVNGGTGIQDTSVTLPTLARLLIGGTGGMELQQLAILPGARTEVQLQALGT